MSKYHCFLQKPRECKLITWFLKKNSKKERKENGPDKGKVGKVYKLCLEKESKPGPSSLAQTHGSYLQFGLILDTCSINSWSCVGLLCSKLDHLLFLVRAITQVLALVGIQFLHLLWCIPWGITTRIRSYSDEMHSIYIAWEIYQFGVY